MDWAHPRIIPVKIWPDFNVLTVQYSQIKTHLKIPPYAPLWLFQPISHSNACNVLNLYGPFEIVMAPKICRASLIIGWIAYNYMEPSEKNDAL